MTVKNFRIGKELEVRNADTVGVSVQPSLNFDFKNSKSLDPKLYYERQTIGTYFDGSTHKAEENLLKYSQDFDQNASDEWDLVGTTVTANSTTAPDGTTTADTLTSSSGGSYHNINQDFTTQNTSTFSIFAKKNTVDFLILAVNTNVSTRCSFNLNTGAKGTEGASVTGTMTDVGNGWYRCSITYTGATVQYYVTVSNTDNLFSYSASGTEAIYIWGAQLEQRDGVSAYTPTTVSPITNFQSTLKTAAANKPRFSIDPVTKEKQGLLLEEQRTNLINYSEAINSWSISNSSVFANEAIAPDANQTADKIALTAGGGYALRSISITSGTSYSYSVYMKKAENDFGMLRLQWNGATYDTVNFNLSNGTTSRTPSGVDSTSIIDVGNGWYRCIVTFTPSVSVTTNVQIRTSNLEQTDSSSGYSGTFNGFNGIYAWGAQVEEGDMLSSYIKTEGSTVTREEDDIRIDMNKYGGATTKGSIFVDVDQGLITGSGHYVIMFSTSETNYINWHGIRRTLTGVYYNTRNGAVNSTISLNNPAGNMKIAYSFDNSTWFFALDGTAYNTNTVLVPTHNTNSTWLKIGGLQNAVQGVNYFKRVIFYPEALTENELVTLTE